MQIPLHSARFHQTYYHKTGEGPTLILLHGFAEDSSIFRYQVAALQQHYTIICPDIPGSGASALGNEEMSMVYIADFVAAIIEQEGCGQVILIGHSMGGYATLAFAEKFPDKLLAFGLLHSTAFADDEAKKENRRKSINLIRHDGKEIFLRAMVPNLYGERAKKNLPDELTQHLTIALKITSESLIAYYDAMILRPDRTAVLKNNNLPVLFVIGKQDNAVPYMDMLTQSTLPNSSFVSLLPDIGHTGMLESPEKVNEALNNFCAFVLQEKMLNFTKSE